jgi:hypothetical protein
MARNLPMGIRNTSYAGHAARRGAVLVARPPCRVGRRAAGASTTVAAAWDSDAPVSRVQYVVQAIKKGPLKLDLTERAENAGSAILSRFQGVGTLVSRGVVGGVRCWRTH